jgi:hypothetical protein
MSSELELPAGEVVVAALEASLTDLLAEYIDFAERRRALEEELDSVKASATALESVLVEQMALAGVQAVNQAGYCVYRRTEVVASIPADRREEAHAALRSVGAGELVKLTEAVNSQSLRAWVREMREQHGELPEAVRPFIAVHELFKLGLRKA